MLAHGVYIETRHIAAVLLGATGLWLGVACMDRVASGRRGGLLRGLLAIVCALLVLVLPLRDYYRGMWGYEGEDLGGYDAPSAAFESVVVRDKYGCWCAPGMILGLVGISWFAIRRFAARRSS